jgi:Fic family protein
MRKRIVMNITATKKDTAKQKVENAINLLKAQKEEINPYKVAKLARISYNTARKYTNTKGE